MSHATALAASIAPVDDIATIRARVQGKNINPDSLLATDYLNHFNEVIMLLGMVPDMPECLDDAKAWAPKSYPQHFRDSGFTDKDLAILAYEYSPPALRRTFDDTVALMNELVARGIQQIESCLAQPDQLAATVRVLSRNLQLLMDVATATIHGRQATMGQDEIDKIMGSFSAPLSTGTGPSGAAEQDAIDRILNA
jgi:hypothetical protein